MIKWLQLFFSRSFLVAGVSGQTEPGVEQSSLPFKQPLRLRFVLERLVMLRVLVLSLILGLTAYDTLGENRSAGAHTREMFLLIAFIYSLSLLNGIWLRRFAVTRRVAYLSIISDVFLATVCMYVSNASVGILLYCVLIAASAVILGSKGSVIIGSLCGLGYGIFFSGIFPTLSGDNYNAQSAEVLAVYLAMVGVALFSAYLARQLEGMSTLAKETARELAVFNSQQKKLFDDISEGIVLIDLEHSITSVNQAAKSILGLEHLDSSKLLGQPFETMLKTRGIIKPEELLNNASGLTELSFDSQGEPAERRVNCSVRDLRDGEGQKTGHLVVFADVSHVRSIEQRLARHEQMAKLLAGNEEQNSRNNLQRRYPEITGSSEVMNKLLELVEKVAASDASVLISGESGTGKELIARAIHATSTREGLVFTGLNCGAIPETLIESELFGHKKGAFTGAVSDTLGLFRQANGGTIFLDEIGELPLHMQTKLLRVLQERTVRPVGDTKDHPVDVRVVAATNRDLKKEISAGRFREDLYYRLNVVSVQIPPLRERKEDIPQLVKVFLEKFSKRTEDAQPTPLPISPEALSLLLDYDFPGNIRELENIIERAVVLGGQSVLAEHLPEEVLRIKGASRQSSKIPGKAETEIFELPVDLESILEGVERRYLTLALRMSGGIKKDAAELLGLNFRSLRYRLKKYGLAEEEGQAEGEKL